MIEKYVLKNAYQFQGKANPKAVLGLILKENPELKKDVPKLLKEIEKVVKEVSKLNLEQIKTKLEKLDPKLLKKQKQKITGPLKPLKNAKKGQVVVRIAPSPSGALHIGHAYGASLNHEYAQMYQGKLILRIEDTNPGNIYDKAYQLIEDDIKWLTDNKLTKTIIQSDRLGIYYDYAEKLVNKEKAYVCTCNVDEWREKKSKGEACPCRSLDLKEQQLRYNKMFNGYAEGEAVLKLKTNIEDRNPAMRDFSIMRINEHVHPRTKKEQRVWPLMVFSVAIDDHELGLTHVLNGKDHADNAKKETLIMEYLDKKPPEYQHWGMINFTGLRLSSSQTKLAIEQKEFSGWDDPRLPFLPALRRRGYQPGAFRRYATEIGLSLNDKTVTKEEFWKNVNAFNRELIEPQANRYFFVDDPQEIRIEVEKEAEIDLHPDFPDRGKRKLDVKGSFYISKSDFQQLSEDHLHRLMDCCNFKVEGNNFIYVSDRYDHYKNAQNKGKIIHWVPAQSKIKTEVILDNGLTLTGFGEENLTQLEVGTIVQLERRFFARLDKKTKNKLVFLYLHK